MDIKQLNALLAVADTGSATKAADILHIVQPAISRHLKLLEEELGAALFDRERHGMVLTSAGRQFVDRVRPALKELEDARNAMNPRFLQIAGEVAVGFLPSSAEFLVSGLMSRLRQKYPRVQMRSYVAFVAELERSLERAELDFALLYLREGHLSRFDCEPVLKESLFLVGPPDAGLDMQTPVPLGYINEVPIILPPKPNYLRALVDRECQAAGVKLNISAEANSMSLQKSFVLNGLGMTVLSGCTISDEVARGVLTACPIEANLTRRLFLARGTGRPATPATTRVHIELLESVRECIAQGRWPGAVLID